MSRRQELCRNFQRGSCKYGANCRFVHASSQQQQQQQAKNPFGFGSQQQQQAKPNPFGFGSQQQQQAKTNPFGSGSQQQQQPANPFGFGSGSRQQQQSSFGAQQQQQQQKPNPFGFGVQGGATKPFQNKWVRDPSAPTKQQEASQPAASAHTSCTDPVSCRQQIAEDFRNETPLWKLTCYAHLRSGPCDITGDISFEELRAKAYEEGRQGHPLQSIVEGERNLQNAKLAEFNNFLNNPRLSVSQTPSFPTVATLPGVKDNSSFGVPQNNGPPVFNSFSQIGAANNIGPGSRTTPGVPTNNIFGQSTSGVPTNNIFGQSNQTSNPSFPGPTFGRSDMKFGVSGAFGSQISQQSFGSLQGSNKSTGSSYQQSSSSSSHQRDIDRQSQDLLSGIVAPTSASNQAPVEDNKNENQDDSIWLKEKWSIGEIPLGEPPQRHISHVF